jgi:hypothetical protein
VTPWHAVGGLGASRYLAGRVGGREALMPHVPVAFRAGCQRVSGLLLAMWLPACGAVSVVRDLSSCDHVSGIGFVIAGLDTRELVCAPGGDCVFELKVGDTRRLTIQDSSLGPDCTGAVSGVSWGSRTAGIVEMAPNTGLQTVLTATHVGETSIFADLQFNNGQQHRVEPSLQGARLGIRVVAR